MRNFHEMGENRLKISKFHLFDLLKNYHWKVREIQRIDKYLEDTDFQGVVQYGMDAAMPKAQGVIGRALENEVIRRVEKSKRLNKYIEEVNFINDRIPKIQNEQEKVVLDCLLDGLSITAISRHLGMSRQKVTEIRNKIIDRLSD